MDAWVLCSLVFSQQALANQTAGSGSSLWWEPDRAPPPPPRLPGGQVRDPHPLEALPQLPLQESVSLGHPGANTWALMRPSL